MKNYLNYLLLKNYELSCQIPKTGNFLALLTAFAICSCVAGFLYMVPGRHNLYYGACALSLLYIIFKGGISVNKRMLLFYVIILANVAFLNIDPMFRSQLRALNFIFVTLVCSPILKSHVAIAYRERVFKYVLIGFTILTVLSFFCFFAGINMMPFNREGSMELYNDYQNIGGKFSGLFGHSMIYGPISALVALVHFNLYLKHNDKIWIILFFLCSMSCVFSASRAALFGLGLGIAFVLYKAKSSRNTYISNRKLGVLMLFVGLAVLPIADIAFKGVLNKMEITRDQFGGYSSRDSKFDCRMAEFEKSPIMGVGFASIDISTGDAYEPLTGQIEPGTAHLAVLAQTGLIGMIAYLMLLFGALAIIKRKTSINAYIACSLFWFFFGHGWAEGWIFAAGGMICFMFWLSLAQCYDLEYKE